MELWSWLFRFVHVSPLFVCHPVPWPELKGHLGVQESFLNHVCECWYGSLHPAEGARGRFTPHDQERWRPFPRQPIFPSLCFPPTPLLRQCWRRSSLISPEPTGLFFHLRIPPSRRRGRSAFHIFCLFKSLAAFQSVHFLPPCRRAVSLSWPRLFMPSSPLQLWDEIFQSATLSRPLLPPLSPLVSAVPHRRKNCFWFFACCVLVYFVLDPLEISVCLSVSPKSRSARVHPDGPIIVTLWSKWCSHESNDNKEAVKIVKTVKTILFFLFNILPFADFYFSFLSKSQSKTGNDYFCLFKRVQKPNLQKN